MAGASPSKKRSVKGEFKAAVAFVTSGADVHASDSTKLKFYAAYKQATEGPVKHPAPSRLRFVSRAKWDAWNALRSTSSREAMKLYIKALDEAAPEWRGHMQMTSKL